MPIETRWYVVHTYSGYENKVADSIVKMAENRKMQDLILEVKIPTETVTDAEKRRRSSASSFPDMFSSRSRLRRIKTIAPR